MSKLPQSLDQYIQHLGGRGVLHTQIDEVVLLKDAQNLRDLVVDSAC